MEFLRNNTPRGENKTTVVTGSSLSDAYRKVRLEFGPDAVISGSRSRTRRKDNGWGSEQVIDVMVEKPGSARLVGEETTDARGHVTSQIKYEVERLEKMVEEIIKADAPATEETGGSADNPLGEFLTGNGASTGAVERLLTRFAGETGKPRNDRPGALAWLNGHLAAGDTQPADIDGTHAFLTENAGDRFETAGHLAHAMTRADRRALLLAVIPDPDRDVARLQKLAENIGCDAAVIREIEQLDDLTGRFPGYDAVLVDLPALSDPAMAENGPIHRALAGDADIRRHLQIPAERDFLDLADLREAARAWNGDHLVLTRLETTRRPAKILDLVDAIPLPVSFLVRGDARHGFLQAATADRLLDLILKTEPDPRFTSGLGAETV